MHYVIQVTVYIPDAGDSLRLEDGQAVQLEDGTTAFIHHASKGKEHFDMFKFAQNTVIVISFHSILMLYLISRTMLGEF